MNSASFAALMKYLWVSILICMFGGLILASGIKFLRRRATLNIPLSKIRNLKPGLVKVLGKVISKQDKLLKSLIHNDDCVYYNYLVEDLSPTLKRGGRPDVARGEAWAPFCLEDESGSISVDLSGVKFDDISLSNDYEYELHADDDQTPQNITDFLQTDTIKRKLSGGEVASLFRTGNGSVISDALRFLA